MIILTLLWEITAILAFGLLELFLKIHYNDPTIFIWAEWIDKME